MSGEIVVASKEAEQRRSSKNREPVRRNPRKLVALGGLAVVGVGTLVAGGLFVKNMFEEEPQQTFGLSTDLEICDAESEQNASYSVPIVTDGQLVTLHTSTDSIGDLVDVIASTDGSLEIENLSDNVEQRLVGTGNEEVIEIFDAKGDGAEDNKQLMRIWSDGDPLQLVFSAPCE